jgi:hypothetical protein
MPGKNRVLLLVERVCWVRPVERPAKVGALHGFRGRSIRPHQSLGDVPLDQANAPPPDRPPDRPIAGEIGPVRRYSILGGLLNHYERKAA